MGVLISVKNLPRFHSSFSSLISSISLYNQSSPSLFSSFPSLFSSISVVLSISPAFCLSNPYSLLDKDMLKELADDSYSPSTTCSAHVLVCRDLGVFQVHGLDYIYRIQGFARVSF